MNGEGATQTICESGLGLTQLLVPELILPQGSSHQLTLSDKPPGRSRQLISLPPCHFLSSVSHHRRPGLCLPHRQRRWSRKLPSPVSQLQVLQLHLARCRNQVRCLHRQRRSLHSEDRPGSGDLLIDLLVVELYI